MSFSPPTHSLHTLMHLPHVVAVDTVDACQAAAARAEFFTCALPHKHPRTYDRLIALQQELQWEVRWGRRGREADGASKRETDGREGVCVRVCVCVKFIRRWVVVRVRSREIQGPFHMSPARSPL